MTFGAMDLGIHRHVPEDFYHTDPCATPSLSQSIAKVIIERSEAHAWLEHPRLGGIPRKATHRMDIGSICHAMMLGQPLTEVELIPFDDYRTKDAKALRDLAIEAGKIPMKSSEMGEWEKLNLAAEKLRNNLLRRGIEFKPDDCEVMFVWEKDGVLCRARLDNLQGSAVIDLKFVEDASPAAVDRKVFDMGYDIQHAAYTEAVRECVPDSAGRESFTVVFCEIVPPYAVNPVKLGPSAKLLGDLKWNQARERWKAALASDYWPEYVGRDDCYVVEAKPWQLDKFSGSNPLLAGD